MVERNRPERGMGKTLIIANPTARSGAAHQTAERIRRFLGLYAHSGSSFEMTFTQGSRHATQLAAQANGFDTVVALGGDGVVHEVVNGIMQKPMHSRPALGVIPVGSGNDFARTIGVSTDLAEHIERLLEYPVRVLDVGRVDYVPSQQPTEQAVSYFMETFSFGLDAAIALDTVERRKQTGRSGAPLYMASGLDIFCRRFRNYPADVSIDEKDLGTVESLIFAVQNGPTYGSGFSICPDAQPDDGLFDICYAAGNVPRIIALPLFLRAKTGRHVASRLIHIQRARKLDLAFKEDDYPIQVDGEQICAARASITIEPRSLRVLAPVK